MTINRNNYEEYLLLYADSELSPAAMQLVEAFLAANPDLQEELSMLQQAILTPEPLLFDGKTSLLKGNAIPQSLQEQMLMSIDGELPAAETLQLQAMMATDALLAKEWSLLQQTKLPVETVSFNDKAALYKKENDRVIPIGWWKMAAAALLIGFGIWGTVSYVQDDKGNSTNSIVITQPSAIPDNPAQQTPVVVAVGDSTAANDAASVATSLNNPTITTVQPTRQHPGTKQQQPTGTPVINTVVNRNEKNNPEETIQQTPLQTINNNDRNNIALQNVPPSTNQQQANTTGTGTDASIDNDVALEESAQQNSIVRYASFDEDDDDEKPKRKRSGGFLKQVKRVLERKANIKTSDDNSIKIANMSFAMH